VKLLLKNLLFTIFIPGTVAVYVPLLIAWGRGITTYPWLSRFGIFVIAMGAAIYTWTVWDFASFGGGTPLPIDAPKTLVVRGLYRYTRNPMYLGVILIILGWVGIFEDGWLFVYALVVGLTVHLFVIRYEEPRLKQLFGVDYEVYQSIVSRWVPHIRGYQRYKS
jgi:protein-S-isoprenylcysteine O-methyltransferase Ste14